MAVGILLFPKNGRLGVEQRDAGRRAVDRRHLVGETVDVDERPAGAVGVRRAVIDVADQRRIDRLFPYPCRRRSLVVQGVLPELCPRHRRRNMHGARTVGDNMVLAIEYRLVVETVQ